MLRVVRRPAEPAQPATVSIARGDRQRVLPDGAFAWGASLTPAGMGPAVTLEGGVDTAAFGACIQPPLAPALQPGLPLAGRRL